MSGRLPAITPSASTPARKNCRAITSEVKLDFVHHFKGGQHSVDTGPPKMVKTIIKIEYQGKC
jgi:hypothetical protein